MLKFHTLLFFRLSENWFLGTCFTVERPQTLDSERSRCVVSVMSSVYYVLGQVI